MCGYQNFFCTPSRLPTTQPPPCGTTHSPCSPTVCSCLKTIILTSWTPCFTDGRQWLTGCSAGCLHSLTLPTAALTLSFSVLLSSHLVAQSWTSAVPRLSSLIRKTLIFIIKAKLKENYLLIAWWGENFIVFGQINTEKHVFVLLHESVSFDRDDVLKLYLRPLCFLGLQVVRVHFLDHHFRPRPRIHLHLQPLVLVHLHKRVAGYVQLLQRGKVPSAYQVVLILDNIVRKVQLNQGPKVPCNQLLGVDPSNLVARHRQELNRRQGS